MMNNFPPDGAYAVADPYRPGTLSYWQVRGPGLEAWPTGAGNKYGPPRPPKHAPGSTLEQRRDLMKFWRAQVEDYRLEVLKRIAADPSGAAARFAQATERCPACRGMHRAEELPDSAAAGMGPVREKLTAEQRQAMVADLRRAGHPEALIAQALGIGAKTVNTDARRAGIGAPLRPKNGAQA